MKFLPLPSLAHASHRLLQLLLPGVALASVLLPLSTACAQAPKIFVASFGNDANDGTRNAPKRNFQPAHDAVAAGGQIVVLDTAGYGTLNITKSLAVTVPPGVTGFITSSGAATAISVGGGTSAVVALRGLIIENSNPTPAGVGVFVSAVGNLTMEDCTVRNFGFGMWVDRFNNGKQYLYNSTFRRCSTGISVLAGDGGANTATINGCRLEQNETGLGAGFPNSGSADVTVSGCVVSGSTTVGISSNTANAVIRVSDSSITGNNVGIAVNNSGQVLSRGNNTLENNTSGNTFPGAYSAK